MKTFAERTALITGASSGFGLLTTVTLALRGWRVLATMRDLARREKLEAAAQAAGVLDRIEFHALDVTNAAQLDTLARTFAAREVHAIVNNAGFAMAGFADDVTDAELRRQFDTNFFGAAAVTRAFLPQFRRQGAGHIVMLSSISGRMGFPGVGSYCASKFALEGWSETLRLELKPLGIQVVLVEPGSFETGIWTRGAAISAGTLDARSSPNASRIANWRARLNTTKPRANPQTVADGIASILDNPHPRLRYVYGKDAQMGLLLRRFLPSSLLERLIVKASGAGN
jgi:NAD(P)-dependent dehydrogenase (short-subunit alcohol dehydrogenase family)